MHILDEIKEIKSGRTELRNFAYVMASALIIVVFFFFSHALVAGGLAAITLVCIGLWAPRVLVWPYRAWMIFGIVLGFWVSKIILVLTFFGVVVPLGLVARMFGKRFLQTPTAGDSYWRERVSPSANNEQYTRQF